MYLTYWKPNKEKSILKKEKKTTNGLFFFQIILLDVVWSWLRVVFVEDLLYFVEISLQLFQLPKTTSKSTEKEKYIFI